MSYVRVWEWNYTTHIGLSTDVGVEEICCKTTELYIWIQHVSCWAFFFAVLHSYSFLPLPFHPLWWWLCRYCVWMLYFHPSKHILSHSLWNTLDLILLMLIIELHWFFGLYMWFLFPLLLCRLLCQRKHETAAILYCIAETFTWGYLHFSFLTAIGWQLYILHRCFRYFDYSSCS